MTIPFLIFLTILTNCSDFHLDRNFTLPTVSTISSMTNIDDLKLGIIQIINSTNNFFTISIFSGNNYQ